MGNNTVKPVLRWAGGKKWLVKHLTDIIDCEFEYNNYFEPFVGGASMFLSFSPSNNVYLSDLNDALISTYKTIRDKPDGIIEILKTYKNEEAFYYSLRKKKVHSDIENAAKFIYLNQTSYNGLYRVNNKGEYNVPYGYRKKNFLDEINLLEFSKRLENASLRCCDFETIKENIHTGDLIFLDPPYTVSHNNNGFIKYNQKLFSLEDQYRLSSFINEIKKKGAFYMLTNAAHLEIDKIFDQGDRKIELSRASLIGGTNAKRENVKEYVFTNIRGAR